MASEQTLGEVLRSRGISRRGFLKFCAATTSMMALPPSMTGAVAAALDKARRPSVIWLSFQECTGCTESLTRAHSPSLELRATTPNWLNRASSVITPSASASLR